MFRSLLSLAAVLTMTAAGVLVTAPAAVAVQAPETLTDRRPVQAGPVQPRFPIDHVGVIWDTDDPDHGHAHSDSPAEIRFRTDGQWSPWRPLIADGADHPDHWASGLVAGGDADAYQVRGVPEDATDPRVVALNTTDGPLRTVGHRPAGAAAAIDRCVSRAEWGADEDLRFDGEGNEVWPPEHYPVQTMTVHHTATDNDDPDPDATVRAIYEYHAVDQGWGDIGYHYLIDEDGRVYEGRWSGDASTRCDVGGDGNEFAHDTADELVTAGHTGGYNSGNMGAALLGEFTTHPRFGAEPEQAAVDALEALLAEFASRHDLDPHATVDYVNPVNSDTRTVDMISGHRDWKSTECPGDRLYDDLPAIRDAVAAQMTTVDVAINAPADGALVNETVTVEADASADVGVSQVEFHVDGTGGEPVATDSDGSNGWSYDWDTTAHEDGDHTVTATATDGDGHTASDTITVTVDNVDSPPNVTLTNPADGDLLSGTVDVTADATDDRQVDHVTFTVTVDNGNTTTLGTDFDGSDGWSSSWDTANYDDGDHTVTATATDDGGQTASASVAVTVDNSGPTSLHVGDLDGATTDQGKTWTATVTVTVHDAAEEPVSGADLAGTWTAATGQGTAACTTGADGTCRVEFSGIHKHDKNATYTVDDVAGELTYIADDNHDPDGDSDGSSITITR